MHIKRILVVMALMVGLVGFVGVQPSAADHSNPCGVVGGVSASWGCGAGFWTGVNKGTVILDDTHTDGQCIRIRAEVGNNIWQDVGIQHCSGTATAYDFTVGSSGERIRMYRTNSSWYRTLDYNNPYN